MNFGDRLLAVVNAEITIALIITNASILLGNDADLRTKGAESCAQVEESLTSGSRRSVSSSGGGGVVILIHT